MLRCGCGRVFCAFAAMGISVAAVFSLSARADIFEWTNPVSGNYATAVNWTLVGAGGAPPPNAGDEARFNEAGTYTVTFTAPEASDFLNLTAGNVTFRSSGTDRTYSLITGAMDATISGGTLTLGVASDPLNLTVGDILTVNGAATLNVNFGSDVNTSLLLLAQNGGNGTIVVDGAGSQFNVTNAFSAGQNGNTATLTYRNAATGSLGALTLANSGNAASAATLNVESGAMVTAGNLSVGPSSSAAATGTVNIEGAGSLLTLNPASTLTVGGTVGVGEINIGRTVSGGTLNTGNGTTTINAGGTVFVSSAGSTGTFNVNGDLNINGGTIGHVNGGINLASGTTMTIQNGGSADFVGALEYVTPADVTYNIITGGSISATAGLNIGTLGTNTFTVDGAGSSATGVTPPALTQWGKDGGVANVTFSNSATGTFGGIEMANSAIAGTTTDVDILSGADVTLNNSLSLAASGGATTSAMLDIQGSGSTLIQSGAVGVTVGHASEGTATINIGTTASGAELETGTGTLTINATGTVNVGSGANTGTLFPGGNVTINGGELNVAQGSNFGLGVATMAIQNGGRASFGETYVTRPAIYNIDGTDSTLETLAGSFGILNDAQVNVLAGGRLSSSNTIFIASSLESNGTLTVDGAGSSVTAAGAFSPWGAAGSTATVVFRNNATGTFAGEIRMAQNTGGPTANVTIESGADLTTGGLSLATLGGATANLMIDGDGSTVNLNPGTDLTIGHASSGTAIIDVEDGGALTVGTGGETILNATGTVNIDGGSVDLQTLTDNGGTINFTAGSLSYLGNLTVGVSGLLGTDLTLTGTRQLTLDGTTTVDAFHTLTLDGGSFSTGSLVVNGTIAFNAGTLSVTGAGGLTIGAGGPLGSAFTLGAGRTLNVTDTATINSGALLVIESGGALNAGTLANSGTVVLDGAAAVLGGTTINNNGLVRGEGTISANLTNTAGGEIRAQSGKTLTFTGTSGPNAGTINLQGGSLEFSQPLTNSATGQILGRGMLNVAGAGLTNSGHIALSSGVSDVFGDVTNNTGNASLGITVSGNADVTFWDDVTNSSGLFRVSAGSSATFFGAFAGAGISGTGDVYFEADITPGSSPGIAAFGGNVQLGELATLQIELAGTAPGTLYDQIQVSGQLSLAGTLDVTLINGFAPQAGQFFDILDWASLAGAFDVLQLPELSGELVWNSSQLYETGALSVALAGDFNFDGSVDAADYVVWRETDGTQQGYDTWRSNFGATAGGGSAGASPWPAAARREPRPSTRVPEPSGMALLSSCCAGYWMLARARRS
jgi:hypothetical protein